ncbi:MAG: hypothetical protein RLZ25_1227 [Pseudomonadota bacterium]|jgi:hypothetical protein
MFDSSLLKKESTFLFDQADEKSPSLIEIDWLSPSSVFTLDLGFSDVPGIYFVMFLTLKPSTRIAALFFAEQHRVRVKEIHALMGHV